MNGGGDDRKQPAAPPHPGKGVYEKIHYCGYCNQPYTAYNPASKYCKPAHRTRAAEERKRLRVQEPARRE